MAARSSRPGWPQTPRRDIGAVPARARSQATPACGRVATAVRGFAPVSGAGGDYLEQVVNKPTPPVVATARRLPPLKRLAAEVRAGRQQKRPVAEYANWLAAHSGNLARWSDVEDLALAAYGDAPDNYARAVCHRLTMVRAELARQLWSRHVFVGVTVLDDLLFGAARSGAADPVLSVLETLRDSRLDMQSLFVFPLQS